MITPIRLVANGVLPKAPLPYPALVTLVSGGVDLARGGFLYFTPAGGVIGIALGQSPEAVQVFGQDDYGVDLEGANGHDFAKGGAQCFDVRFVDEDGRAVVGDDGEEVGATGEVGAVVVAHGCGFGFGLVDALRLSTLRLRVRDW